MLGLTPPSERDHVLQCLVQTVRDDRNKLTAGFIGTMPTFYVLTDGGYGDLAYEMLKDGWLHMLDNGDASTLGESPYSFGSGHHQFGACIAGWMYKCLAGIRPDLSGPGYKRITIKPSMIGDLTWVKAHYDSVYGRIVSNWKRDGETVTMDVTIPVNTTATVYVPAMNAEQVTESGKPAAQAEGVAFQRMAKDSAIYELAPGTYHFRSSANSQNHRRTLTAWSAAIQYNIVSMRGRMHDS